MTAALLAAGSIFSAIPAGASVPAADTAMTEIRQKTADLEDAGDTSFINAGDTSFINTENDDGDTSLIDTENVDGESVAAKGSAETADSTETHPESQMNDQQENQTGQENQIGTLTVCYAVHDGELPLDGGRFSIIRVADLVNRRAGIYRLCDPFSETGISFDGMSRQETAEAAKTFAEMFTDRHLASQADGITDDSGKAVFTIRDPGIYLVLQTGSEEKSAASGYENIDPFLVSVPDRQNNGAAGRSETLTGAVSDASDDETDITVADVDDTPSGTEDGWDYDITAWPKTEPKKKEEDLVGTPEAQAVSSSEKPSGDGSRNGTDEAGDDEGGKKGAGTVQTGDSDIMLIFGSAAAVLLITGVILSHKKGGGKNK